MTVKRFIKTLCILIMVQYILSGCSMRTPADIIDRHEKDARLTTEPFEKKQPEMNISLNETSNKLDMQVFIRVGLIPFHGNITKIWFYIEDHSVTPAHRLIKAFSGSNNLYEYFHDPARGVTFTDAEFFLDEYSTATIDRSDLQAENYTGFDPTNEFFVTIAAMFNLRQVDGNKTCCKIDGDCSDGLLRCSDSYTVEVGLVMRGGSTFEFMPIEGTEPQPLTFKVKSIIPDQNGFLSPSDVIIINFSHPVGPDDADLNDDIIVREFGVQIPNPNSNAGAAYTTNTSGDEVTIALTGLTVGQKIDLLVAAGATI